jgi:hypothetical protein
MDKEPEEHQPASEQPETEKVEPPPFDPDLRLITQLERGPKPKAERRSREAIENPDP